MAPLLASFTPHPDVSLLRVESPALAASVGAGQFVMARQDGHGWDPFTREPLFVAGRDEGAGALTLWVPGGSPTREALRGLALGRALDLLGPLGSGMAPRREWRNVLLAAEGLAIGPLLAVIESALALGQSVALLGVTPPDQAPYPADALPLSIEYQRAPRGEAGALAQEMLCWADGVVAAGSQRFFHDLATELRAARPGQRGGFAYGLAVEPFGWQAEAMAWGPGRVACGIAACRGCLVELRRDKALACTRGPLFDLWEL